MRDETLIALLLVFVPFSLLSIGGGSAIETPTRETAPQKVAATQ